jgi:hypothetical protein
MDTDVAESNRVVNAEIAAKDRQVVSDVGSRRRVKRLKFGVLAHDVELRKIGGCW